MYIRLVPLIRFLQVSLLGGDSGLEVMLVIVWSSERKNIHDIGADTLWSIMEITE